MSNDKCVHVRFLGIADAKEEIKHIDVSRPTLCRFNEKCVIPYTPIDITRSRLRKRSCVSRNNYAENKNDSSSDHDNEKEETHSNFSDENPLDLETELRSTELENADGVPYLTGNLVFGFKNSLKPSRNTSKSIVSPKSKKLNLENKDVDMADVTPHKKAVSPASKSPRVDSTCNDSLIRRRLARARPLALVSDDLAVDSSSSDDPELPARPTSLSDHENYFKVHSSRAITSDRTLAGLSKPTLSTIDLQCVFEAEDSAHSTHRADLLKLCQSYFPRWMLQMIYGYNIMTYGLGSKRALLHSFCEHMLQKQWHMVINGYFPDLTYRQVVRTIETEYLGLEQASSQSLQLQIDNIVDHFNQPHSRRLFLLVSCMDGEPMRNEMMQRLLVSMAQARHIHLVASVEHINATCMFSQTQLTAFNFIWYDCTTMVSYREETAYENSLLIQHQSGLLLSSMRQVFQSLTSNCRGVFMLLAKCQVGASEEKSHKGMTMSALYRLARENFFVSSQTTLKSHLNEFRDHKLLATRRSADDEELLYIPISNTLLQRFIDEHS